jgi:nicotinamidase-related amidase
MRPAIVVIDVQNEYFAPHGKWVLPEGEAALANINKLLTAAHNVGVPVFAVLHEESDAAGGVFVAGSIGAQIHPDLHLLPGDPHITKHFPGSFTQTTLEPQLRQGEIDTLVICGYMTQLCCDTTTRQADERGYQVWFTADGTAARSLKRDGIIISHQQVQETTLAVMTQFSRVLASEEIISQLQDSGPEVSK